MDREHQEKTEKRWKKFQKAMEYTDEELAIFRSNPKFVKAMEHAPKFVTHKIIVEVVESHNCVAGHKAGDKFVMNGNGHLIRDECPEYMCSQAIASFMPLIFGMYERFHEDLDPNGLLLNIAHCNDVGCRHGGWGEIIMKMYAVEISRRKRQD